MTPLEIEFIAKTIGSEQKQFYYYRDKYALQLLQYHVKDNIKISELKNSKYQGLLSKSLVQEVLKDRGSGVLYAQSLLDKWDRRTKSFNYTIDHWGENVAHRNDCWNQTTRPGLNLVLQLNFDDWHNYKYHQLIKDEYEDNPFENCGHPIASKRNFTMAWARLDIDLNTGEMLVEEIQNDWLREVRDLEMDLVKEKRRSSKWRKDHWFFAYYPVRKFLNYSLVLSQYQKLWDEAILSLAIHFAKVELGLDKVYYHDFDSGNLLKGLTYSKPPKSLYTKLPKRFCFEQTDEAPEFIQKEKYLKKKLRKNDLRWWVYRLND